MILRPYVNKIVYSIALAIDAIAPEMPYCRVTNTI